MLIIHVAYNDNEGTHLVFLFQKLLQLNLQEFSDFQA